MGQVVALRKRTHPAGEPEDGELVRAAVAGEMRARELLFRRHYPRVLRLAYRLMGRDDLAEDLAQEVCVQALKGLEGLQKPERFGSWVFSICVFRAKGRIRRQAIKRRLGFSGTVVDPDQVVSRTAPADVRHELKALYQHLLELPAEVRIALVLRRIEGMTIPEMSEHMGRSPATVKRRLAEGLKHLQRWQQEGGER